MMWKNKTFPKLRMDVQCVRRWQKLAVFLKALLRFIAVFVKHPLDGMFPCGSHLEKAGNRHPECHRLL